MPDQAVLIDLANIAFYFFFIEIWPQEIFYVAGLLILASFILFLMTTLASFGALLMFKRFGPTFHRGRKADRGDRRSPASGSGRLS